MDEDRCENCYWYWSGEQGYECHKPMYNGGPRRKKIINGEPRQEVCGWFEQKYQKPVVDEYEQYQEEWN